MHPSRGWPLAWGLWLAGWCGASGAAADMRAAEAGAAFDGNPQDAGLADGGEADAGLGGATFELTREACPLLFGDVHDMERNAAYRTARLETVRRTDQELTVEHSLARWQAPQLARLAGVRVVAIVPVEDDARGDYAAGVILDDDLAARCDGVPGPYWLFRDDAIGRDVQILAIVEDAILLERAGTLGLMAPAGAVAPPVRLVWHSSFQLVVDEGAGISSSSSRTSKSKLSAAERRKRRKQKAKKRRATKKRKRRR